MQEAPSEKSKLREKYEGTSLMGLMGVFSKLSADKLSTNLIKEVINEKLSTAIDDAKQIKDIKVLSNNVIKVLGDENITPENKEKINSLKEKAMRSLTDQINGATSPQDLKIIMPDIKMYEGIDKLFDSKKNELYQKYEKDLRDPNIPLDEKLMNYTTAEESKVFDAKEMGALKETLKEQISSKVDAIKKDQPLPSFKEILTLNLCVKALNDPSVSKAFESKQKILKSKLSEKTAIASFDEIDQDQKLTAVEKTQQIDGLLATYQSLHGKVPEKLEQKYAELSEKYRDQTVSTLHEYSTGLFANLDVDAMQHQAFNKDRSQRKPPGETDAGKPLSGGFNAISGSVVNSVLENRDFNAGILATKRWIETAAIAYQRGDLYTAQAVLSGLKTAIVYPYLNAVIEEKGVHAEAKAALDITLSSDRAYKNLRASETLAGNKCLPAVGYKFSDMTFTYEGNPRKEGEADKRPLLLEPFYSEFRTRKNSLGKAPPKNLADAFGTALMQPVSEQSSDRYRKIIVTNKEKPLPIHFQSKEIAKTKDDLSGIASDMTKKNAEDQEEKDNKAKEEKETQAKMTPEEKEALEQQKEIEKGKERAELLQKAEAYNKHMENNGGISKNFYSSPEYAAFLKAQHQGAGIRPMSEQIAKESEQKAQRGQRDSQAGSFKGSSTPNKWSSIATLPTARSSISSATNSPLLGRSRSNQIARGPLPEQAAALPETNENKTPEDSQAKKDSSQKMVSQLQSGKLPKAAPPPLPPLPPEETAVKTAVKSNAEVSKDDMMGPSTSGQSEKQSPPLPELPKEKEKEAPKTLQSGRAPPPSHMRK